MSTSNIKKSKRQSLLALLLIVALTITGVFAFLTATTDTKENKFTVGNIKIDVDEGRWDEAADDNDNGVPDFAENIVSGQILEKSPKIVNKGSNKAWAYVLVSIPKAANVKIADDEGFVTTPAESELFALYTGTEGAYTKGYNTADWVLLDGVTKPDDDGEYNHYVYAYNKELEADGETSALFDAVRFANITEEFAATTTEPLTVKVTGLAIQTDTSFVDYNDAWAALVADNGMADYPIQAVSAQG